MSAETILQTKSSRQNGAAGIVLAVGNEYSSWQFDGNPSSGAVSPATFANPTNATAGALMQSDPPGGKQKWMTSLIVAGAFQGRAVLYDRLLHMSGFSGNVAGAQNVNGGSVATLSRHYQDDLGTQDVGNEILIEVNSALGATPTTISAVYTNQAGTLSQVTQAATIPANLGAQRVVRVPLAAGDTGVRDITSVALAAPTGTVGNFSVIVAHRLSEHEIAASGVPEQWTCVAGDAKEILTGACLFWTWAPTIASTATSFPFLAFYQFGDW